MLHSSLETHVTIIDTTDLVEAFEQRLGVTLASNDQLEFFKQLFQLLDAHAPVELNNRDVLVYESFVFANHLTLNTVALDETAFAVMDQLWHRLQQHNFYIDGVLMYFPWEMHGKDLCVRRYSN